MYTLIVWSWVTNPSAGNSGALQPAVTIIPGMSQTLAYAAATAIYAKNGTAGIGGNNGDLNIAAAVFQSA